MTLNQKIHLKSCLDGVKVKGIYVKLLMRCEKRRIMRVDIGELLFLSSTHIIINNCIPEFFEMNAPELYHTLIEYDRVEWGLNARDVLIVDRAQLRKPDGAVALLATRLDLDSFSFIDRGLDFGAGRGHPHYLAVQFHEHKNGLFLPDYDVRCPVVLRGNELDIAVGTANCVGYTAAGSGLLELVRPVLKGFYARLK